MNLSKELAMTCVKAAASPLEARQEFEDLIGKEENLRQHSSRLKELSRERGLREDMSVGGHVETGLGRLLPVPHTGTEALIRTPLVGAAGVGGYQAGKGYESLDPKDLQRVLAPNDAKAGLRIEQRLENLAMKDVDPSNIHADDLTKIRNQKLEMVKRLTQELGTADPAAVSRALQDKSLRRMSGGATKLRESISNAGLQTPAVRREFENLIRQTADKSIMPKFKPHRIGGGLLGLAAGSALTGLPLALRALYLKRYGGEAATRAQSRADAAIDRAEGASGKRDQILEALESGA